MILLWRNAGCRHAGGIPTHAKGKPVSRAGLLRELEAYAAADARERAMVAEFSAFVRANPNCFERTLTTGHVTASAWVVDEERTHALLTLHRELGRWLQLGGHADGDDDVRGVALREAREESGLSEIRFARTAIYDVDVHDIPARAGEPAHKHYDVRFAFIADRAAPTVVSAESHELAWLPIATLAAGKVDGSVLRLAHKTRLLSVA
jgi:8-oxo-dGTP pyrophosphatase MutT (NUDIX family)